MAKSAKRKQLVAKERKRTPKDAHTAPIEKVEDPITEYISGTAQGIKSQRLELRLTKHQKDFINKASKVSGFKNISDSVLQIAINDSRKVIRDQQLFELSERDRVTFMETLENPPEPGKRLKKARVNYASFQKGK